MITLRDYQADAVERLGQSFARRNRAVLLVSDTGSGKTVMFSRVVAGAVRKNNPVLITAHRQRILEQIDAALEREGIRRGWIAAGRTGTDALAQIGMVQTLANRADKLRPPALIVIDEAHHAVSASYRKLIAAFPNARILGVTATPGRPDGTPLGDVFDDMVQTIPMRELIARGALSRYRYFDPGNNLDLARVRITAGDYNKVDLAGAVAESMIFGDAVTHYKRYMDGAPSVAFCSSVAECERVAQMFNDAGVPGASVDGKMDPAEVSRRLSDLERRHIRVIVSCDLISEGVDVPGLVGCFLLRPTKSIIVHRQQVGRALRPKPDGIPALIFDHVSARQTHGLPDAKIDWTLDGERPKARIIKAMTCEGCYRVFEKVPGWKNQVDCVEPDSKCILTKPLGEGRSGSIEQMDGDLVEYEEAPAPTIATATGDDLKALIRRARTHEELAEIAKIRGYQHGWVRNIERLRAAHNRA